jgi:hypothetical protein
LPLAAVLGRGQSAVPAVTRPAALLLLPGPLDGQPIGVDGRRGGRSCRGGSCRRSSRTAAAATCSSSRGRRRRRLAPLRSFLSHHAPGRLVGIERRRGRRVGDGGGVGMIATRSATTTTITGIRRRHRRRRLGPVLLGRRRPPEVVLERAHAGGRGVVAAGGRRLPAAAAGARHDPDGASAVQSNRGIFTQRQPTAYFWGRLHVRGWGLSGEADGCCVGPTQSSGAVKSTSTNEWAGGRPINMILAWDPPIQWIRLFAERGVARWQLWRDTKE